MAASANDLFMEVGSPGTATTLSAPGYTAGGSSITVGSTSNWPTGTGVIFAIDEAEVVDGEEVQVPGTYNEFEGTVATGTSITNVDWVLGVGDRNYSAGALTRVYIPVSAERENRLAQGMRVQHNQDGTHSAVTATSLTSSNGLTVSGGSISLPSASISQAALPLGAVVQVVTSTSTAAATGTTIMPVDDTIPQNTEGDQYMSITITPKSTTNLLVIEAFALASFSTTTTLAIALFQDSTVSALAANAMRAETATAMYEMSITSSMTAGTTSATTFKVRIGGAGAGTTTFNGSGGSRFFGATNKSFLKVTEYKA